MSRWITVLGFATVLSLSMVSTSFEAEAKSKPKNKQCTATQLDGKQSKFKCKADEKCCFDYIANKGSCVAASAICL